VNLEEWRRTSAMNDYDHVSRGLAHRYSVTFPEGNGLHENVAIGHDGRIMDGGMAAPRPEELVLAGGWLRPRLSLLALESARSRGPISGLSGRRGVAARTRDRTASLATSSTWRVCGRNALGIPAEPRLARRRRPSTDDSHRPRSATRSRRATASTRRHVSPAGSRPRFGPRFPGRSVRGREPRRSPARAPRDYLAHTPRPGPRLTSPTSCSSA